MDALQYAGEQLLRVPDARLALEYFEKLLQQATLRQDVLLAARSKVLQARAYYALPTANLNAANALLGKVVVGFPAGMPPLERASVHELHGDVRADANWANANGSYMSALVIFQTVAVNNGKARDAQEGARRVTLKIAKLNEEDATPAPGDAPAATNVH